MGNLTEVYANGSEVSEKSRNAPMENSNENGESSQIIVGVCAMRKKVLSRPMSEVLTRLSALEHIKVVIFEETMILEQPIDEWPECHALISFYSDGFPLEKAVQYADLRKPYMVNDLKAQHRLKDRAAIYAMLMKHDVPVPKHAVLKRDEDGNITGDNVFIHENDDAIEVNGTIITKPFVEKPIDAENHNINIYFPSSAGGGCVFLFRKTNNRSSCYMKEVNSVRKTGSYIYEEFMPTDGKDVKVYTVGDDYAHAEARKSPSLDGRVERDADGKEVRYPIILTPYEKIMAKKVCRLFQQQVCGFDLLRANGLSYVCDVNGFSFVKSSKKYYEDCGYLLSVIITRAVAPSRLISWTRPIDDPPLMPTTTGSIMELRTVMAVIRHGDRTPKQKLKMEVSHPAMFEIFKKYDGFRTGHVKLKKPKELQDLLDVCRSLLAELERSEEDGDPEIEERKKKYHQMRCVLELYGHFSGLNRKVQFKLHENLEANNILEVVVKWGGELTPEGKRQAESLGCAFRRLYPEVDTLSTGMGLLRLHSTYRHDLKIYASDEGRVQTTAAAFTKGFLALEGELTPILAQMVKSANMNGLLDCDSDCRVYREKVKKRIADVLSKDAQFTEEDFDALAPTAKRSLIFSMKIIMNPFRLCQWLRIHMENLVTEIKQSRRKLRRIPLYNGESWELFHHRWSKLRQDFCRRDGTFDISKVPDIYDNIRYDLMHNSEVINITEYQPLYQYAKHLADVVVPQEYGIKMEEKLKIGQTICRPLIRKLLADARYTDCDDCLTRLNSQYSKDVSSPNRFVRTRLYFTSESHIHALVTCLCYGGLADPESDPEWKRAIEYVDAVPEFNYLSQIVIMIYEDPQKETNAQDRFHVEIHFSPGIYSHGRDLPQGTGYRPQKTEREKKEAQIIMNDTEGVDMTNRELEYSKVFLGGNEEKYGRVSLNDFSDNLTPDVWSTNLDVYSKKGVLAATQFRPGGERNSQPLISTAVITGAVSRAKSAQEFTKYKRSKDAFPVLAASVPEINPLETLHNSLTLSQLESFLERVSTVGVTRMSTTFRSSSFDDHSQ